MNPTVGNTRVFYIIQIQVQFAGAENFFREDLVCFFGKDFFVNGRGKPGNKKPRFRGKLVGQVAGEIENVSCLYRIHILPARKMAERIENLPVLAATIDDLRIKSDPLFFRDRYGISVSAQSRGNPTGRNDQVHSEKNHPPGP